MSVFRTAPNGDPGEINVTPVVTVTEDITLTYEHSNSEILVGTDALTITLPPTKAGIVYVIGNSGADGNNIVTISPDADDAIFGTVQNAAADNVSGGVADKDIVNTKATANKGDYIVLVGDGVDGWYIRGGVGIWASEA